MFPHCHDDLGMATANALAAIENGATQSKERSMALVNGPENTALKRWH